MPVTRPVTGVAMGLLLEGDGGFQILTDILGSEDAMGDMDFKVAGDATHITAFQMDIKVPPWGLCCCWRPPVFILTPFQASMPIYAPLHALQMKQ